MISPPAPGAGLGRDAALGLLLVLTIVLMILPIPTVIVDGLIGLNLGFAILLLMTAVYLGRTLDLSTLPGIILVATIFRLALSVTTTRLILAEGDAGAIVETFGAFVIGGNPVVGLVVFFIITVVQFIVIAKGSERIAEVAARFTLDALPGKQMSIDVELRNGDIDNAVAKHRRAELNKESQFYGAMDGTMKFVKGDAIAGLVIIFVNLLGGLAVGMAQGGLEFGDAIQKYSLLTVGDALISQIPALLISVTAATIVTRVEEDTSRNLGSEIVQQIGRDSRAIRMAALVLAGLSLVPGFPTLLLLCLAALFMLTTMLPQRRAPVPPDPRPEDAGKAAEDMTAPGPAEGTVEGVAPGLIALHLTDPLHDALDGEALTAMITRVGTEVTASLGHACPTITHHRGLDTDTGVDLEIRVEGITAHRDTLRLDALSVIDDRRMLEVADIAFTSDSTEDPQATRAWVAVSDRGRLDETGIPYLTPLALLEQTLGALVHRFFTQFIGIEETRKLMDGWEAAHPALMTEVTRLLTVQQVAEVLRRLAAEKIDISNTRLLLEAFVEWGRPDMSAVLLSEYVRLSFKRQICDRAAGRDRIIPAVVVEGAAERTLRDCLQETSTGEYLVLSPTQMSDISKRIEDAATGSGGATTIPVVLSAMDIRRHIAHLLKKCNIKLDVLSFQEIADDYTVVPVAITRFSIEGERIVEPAE
ncbi:MAG: type III secretion system export apparatus subunit SctV [Pseudomonadota bacterium]